MIIPRYVSPTLPSRKIATKNVTVITDDISFLTYPRTSVLFRKYDCIIIYIHNVSLYRTVAVLIQWKRSAVVETCDPRGNTPLHCASEAGHDLTVQKLIKAKANVNKT